MAQMSCPEEARDQEKIVVREITLCQAGGSDTATRPEDMTNRLGGRPEDRMYAIETDRGGCLHMQTTRS